MPVDKYSRYFGGKQGSAAKAKAAMQQQYGAAKGKSVFYATVNKRRGKRKQHSHRGQGLTRALAERGSRGKGA